jgi:hypothetical protein
MENLPTRSSVWHRQEKGPGFDLAERGVVVWIVLWKICPFLLF